MKPAFVVFALITLGLLSYGLYMALVGAPTERTMGDVQRIFYYHVPSAWVAFLCFAVNAIASIAYLLKRSNTADAIALSTAEVGVVFCTIVLITGPIWARPVWGIWWTWDARLTSTLVLWLIYVAYLILRRFSTTGRAPVLAAALAVFGFFDVPFVYLSIRIFRTQHPQPVVGGGEGSGLDARMAQALLWNLAAFTAYGVMVVWMRYKMEKAERAIDEAYATRAIGEGA